MGGAATKIAALTQDALAAYQSGDLKRAETLFKKAAGAPTAPAQTAYNFAVFLRREGRGKEALYWLDRCLRSVPDHKNAGIERGLALIDLGQLDKAVTAVQGLGAQATAEDHLLRIRALAELDRLDDAQAAGNALGAQRADLRADISKALTRRSKGRFSLIEHQARA